MKKIFIINGSASQNSSNQKLIDHFIDFTKDIFEVKVFNDLKRLPHFDPELSTEDPPKEILQFRWDIESAHGVVICTPEYVFSIPSGLKNAIEWCVSTTVFSGKPTGLITASASGVKGHEELQLIMKTLMADFNSETALLVQGIKGKMNEAGEFLDENLLNDLLRFTEHFEQLILEVKSN